MELREYLAIRRAYNLVRQNMSASNRLTFAELAILCRMDILNRAMNTSEIAEYQHALRPTMTHRAKHLSDAEFIQRSKGSDDRRNVICEITDSGRDFIQEVSSQICEILHAGTVLSRTNSQRICRCIDAMGSVSCMSGDLILLGVSQSDEGHCTISELVSLLGLLQPTVSMSVASLEAEGAVQRVKRESTQGRSVEISLTKSGADLARELEDTIKALVIHRKS